MEGVDSERVGALLSDLGRPGLPGSALAVCAAGEIVVCTRGHGLDLSLAVTSERARGPRFERR